MYKESILAVIWVIYKHMYIQLFKMWSDFFPYMHTYIPLFNIFLANSDG